jgi:LCP family protein required for cell wall assembly
MNGSGNGPPRGRWTARRIWTKRQRWLVVATATGSALVMAISAGLQTFFGDLNGNIATESMSILGAAPPTSQAGVLNVLALGSQTRDGQGPGFGHDPGTDLSDTAMLIHLNSTHTHAIVLSIPRDLIVDRPSCRERVGGDAIVSGDRQAMFDSAMNLGGPACAVATVQAMSGLRIDHFVRLDFNSFRTMTDDLGGVEVCVPKPGIHDWRSHLNISAGLHVISGNEALAFVRDRHGIGNGGDLGRIEMQQMFVSSLIKKVMSHGTLANPALLYNLANTATKSLTTDPGLGSVQALIGLAESLRSLKLHDINFVTLPTTQDPANPDRLLPEQPQTGAIWQLLRADHPWTGHLPLGTQPNAAQAAAQSSPAQASPTQQRAIIRQLAAMATGTGVAGGDPAPAPGVQTRNASANICSGLPTPNNLGELGR